MNTYMERGTCVMNTWDDFIRELKKQFYLENAMMEAKIRLRQLHQTGIIHDYVKDFTTLTLEIHDLSDDDAFVYFFDILKGWAKIELNRWEVKYLATTITEAKDLVDFSQFMF